MYSGGALIHAADACSLKGMVCVCLKYLSENCCQELYPNLRVHPAMFEAQIDRTPFQMIRVLALFVLKMTLNWDSRAPLAMTHSPAWIDWLSRWFVDWLLRCS